MKTVNDIATALIQARTDAAELASTATELEERLDAIQKSLRDVSQNGPLTTTIKTSDAASIRVWLKAARKAHNTFSAEPTPELDRLIDLLPEA